MKNKNQVNEFPKRTQVQEIEEAFTKLLDKTITEVKCVKVMLSDDSEVGDTMRSTPKMEIHLELFERRKNQ